MADSLRVAKHSDSGRHDSDRHDADRPDTDGPDTDRPDTDQHDADEPDADRPADTPVTDQKRPPLRAKIKRRRADDPRPRLADPKAMTLPTGKIRYEIEGGKKPGTDHFEARPRAVNAATYEWEKQRPSIIATLLGEGVSRRRTSPIF
jgi:hypothetical protein